MPRDVQDEEEEEEEEEFSGKRLLGPLPTDSVGEEEEEKVVVEEGILLEREAPKD